ncbi:hypothetical protein [Streptomyces sp. BE230]|uniref:hypothetical protein n=1 Tax=Streptomyces sp. BE230 TaxID=3002526 RepID=UPI002ED44D06|nr:hypothetical protein [Streptomyces sp. BE230]
MSEGRCVTSLSGGEHEGQRPAVGHRFSPVEVVVFVGLRDQRGPRVRPLSRRGSSRAVPASQ